MIECWESCAGAWWRWMFSMAWQSAVFIVLVAVLDRVLRPWLWPQLRLTLWLLALVKLVLPPTLVSVLPWTPQLGTAARLLEPPAGDSSVWLSSACAVWLLVAMVLARFAFRRGRESRLLLEQRRVPFPPPLAETVDRAIGKLHRRWWHRPAWAWSRVPDVWICDGMASPALLTGFRPIIVLPKELVDRCARDSDGNAEREVEHSVLHELAHFRRGDHLLAVVLICLQVVYWFNPLVFVVGRRVRILREFCVDSDVACALGGDHQAYRDTLLRAAGRSLLAPAMRADALALVLSTSTILERLNRLERGPGRFSTLRPALNATLAVFLSFYVLPMASRATGGAVEPSLFQAAYENLKHPEGQGCLVRRASALLLINSGADLLVLEHHLAPNGASTPSTLHSSTPRSSVPTKGKP